MEEELKVEGEEEDHHLDRCQDHHYCLLLTLLGLEEVEESYHLYHLKMIVKKELIMTKFTQIP